MNIASQDKNIFFEAEAFVTGIGSFFGKIGDQVTNMVNTVQEWRDTLDSIEVDEGELNEFGVLVVQGAFENEDSFFINDYLSNCLSLKPSSDRIQALWEIVVRSKRYLQINSYELIKYLRVSVYKQANRIKRDREMSDDLWKRSDNILYGEYNLMLLEGNKETNPESALIREEDRRIREDIIRDLRNNGSPKEQEMLDLLIAGYTPAECIQILGESWSTYQSLQRKLKRKLNKNIS